MAKKRKCKCCGRAFAPKGKGDRYCSTVCRATGLFVGGGGDTAKPGRASKDEAPKSAERVGGGDGRFARVRAMFELPVSERWAVARTFSREEAEYARRLARRQLSADDRIAREMTWECGEEDEVASALTECFGADDSDDGTI